MSSTPCCVDTVRTLISVPPSDAPIQSAIYLSCVGFIDVYVNYVAAVQLNEVLYEDGRNGCHALRSCSVLISLSHPPTSVKTEEDIEVSLHGPVLSRPETNEDSVWIEVRIGIFSDAAFGAWY